MKKSNSSKKFNKWGRLPRFIESLNQAAGQVVCDHEKIYIKNKEEPTEYEAAAILASFLGTDKSEAKFTEIMQSEAVTKNKLASADTFEGATKDGSIDENLENWLFAEGRKSGDYTAELIETEDAFYIVFYVKQEEKPVWYTTTLNSLLNADVEVLQKTLLEEANKVMTTDDDVIADVMEYVAYTYTMSSYY